MDLIKINLYTQFKFMDDFHKIMNNSKFWELKIELILLGGQWILWTKFFIKRI